MEVLTVGVDAACRSVLAPLFDADAIPNLRSIVEDGASGPLESQVPPWTPSAWPSLYTGTNPGKHGVFDFLAFDGYDWEVVDATHVSRRPLWHLLDRHGYASVVVNVPVTNPPEPFDGALVPGYVAPERPHCHPGGLMDEIEDEIGDYRIYPAYEGDADATRDEQVEEHVALSRMRGRAFRYLADRFEPEFGFVQFQQTDTVFHELPGDADAVRAVYGAVDEAVGEIVAAVDPDAVFVVSDHGIGKYDGCEVRVNEVLRDSGFVRPVRGGRGMPTWATVRDAELKYGERRGSADPGLLERAVGHLAATGLTSQRIGAVFEAVGIDEFVLERVPASVVRTGTEQVDFPGSRAYMRSRIECGVRLNLAGREPDGTVPAEDYESVRRELISLLESVRTPDGDPAFENVAPREAYYHGPHVEDAVDVVTVPAGFDQFLSARLAGDRFGEPTEPWNHKRDGIFAAAGSAVRTDVSVEDAHLFDVAPTVLAAFGVPADREMDGRVLPVVEAVGSRSYPPFERDAAGSTAARDVEDRLADLGYIE